MSETAKKQLYAFVLDDYAAPSCTSFTKQYFGTIADFRAVLENMGKENEERMEDIFNTFEHFAAVDRKIIYHAGQCVSRFAKPARIIQDKTICFGQVDYRYENSYGFFYDVRMSGAEGRVAVVKLGKQFYIVYWMCVKNPRYKDELLPKIKWQALGSMIWGYPGILRIQNKTITNLLGMIDSGYETEEEAIARFESLDSLDWNRFYEDVFGDG